MHKPFAIIMNTEYSSIGRSCSLCREPAGGGSDVESETARNISIQFNKNSIYNHTQTW